ncbi:MAG: hypothetical protein COB02_17635 [Candidatus Cloacimonadota bacterium]|nr:MAG: hypothetical protein COB02_17635 [Candidatus Cloacimonadota bacterium]
MDILQDSDYLKLLKKLTLFSKHQHSGRRLGERLTKKKGSSVEFKDYREYYPGDDIRFVDWNLWGRLDKYYIKLFYNEENQNVFSLFDVSNSMFSPEKAKIDFLKKFIGAISYLSLNQKDNVKLFPYCDHIISTGPEAYSLGSWPLFAKYLSEIKSTKSSNLAISVDEFLKREKQRGILFLVSDFLHDLSSLEYALKKLSFYKFEVNVIQIMSKSELEPDLSGNYLLKDSETGVKIEVEIENEYRLLYQERCLEHLKDVEKLSKKYGCLYRLANCDDSFEDFMIHLFSK